MEKIRLRVRNVQCVDTTSGPGSDQIDLAGVSIDATGDTRKIPIRTVSNYFDPGDVVNYSPPQVFATFDIASDDLVNGKPIGWARTYHVTFFMCERDNGGFPGWLQDLFLKVKEYVSAKVAAAVGAAIFAGVGSLAGPLGAAIGAAIGFVLGAAFDIIFGWIKVLWEDDPFPPVTVGITLPWGFSFGEVEQSGEKTVWWKAQGGHYRLHFDWQLGGPTIVAGVFRAGSAPHALWTADRPGFTQKFLDNHAAGMRIVGLSTYLDGDRPMISGAFLAGSGKSYLWFAEWAEFVAKWKQLGEQEYRLVDIDSYLEAGTRRFVGAFAGGADPYQLWRLKWSDFTAKTNELFASGFRLVAINSFVDNGTPTFVGAWRQGTGGQWLWSSKWSEFEPKWQELSSQGARLERLSSHMAGGTRIYTGLFREGVGPHALWISDRWSDFSTKWQQLSNLGYQLVDVEM